MFCGAAQAEGCAASTPKIRNPTVRVAVLTGSGGLLSCVPVGVLSLCAAEAKPCRLPVHCNLRPILLLAPLAAESYNISLMPVRIVLRDAAQAIARAPSVPEIRQAKIQVAVLARLRGLVSRIPLWVISFGTRGAETRGHLVADAVIPLVLLAVLTCPSRSNVALVPFWVFRFGTRETIGCSPTLVTVPGARLHAAVRAHVEAVVMSLGGGACTRVGGRRVVGQLVVRDLLALFILFL